MVDNKLIEVACAVSLLKNTAEKLLRELSRQQVALERMLGNTSDNWVTIEFARNVGGVDQCEEGELERSA